jgi:hypothetical protein
LRRTWCLLACAVVALVAVAPPATAAVVRGQWTMAPSGRVVSDRAGRADLHLFGSWTTVAGAVGRAVRFRWAGRPSGATVRSHTDFNPGSAQFAVGVTLKAESVPATGGYSPNVVQKGLFDGRGQWKLELVHLRSHTVARCRFSGTRGRHSVVDRRATPLDNGRWHAVVCWRTTSAYGISVDGVTTSRRGTVGSIASSRPLRLASKTDTAGSPTSSRGPSTALRTCVASIR